MRIFPNIFFQSTRTCWASYSWRVCRFPPTPEHWSSIAAAAVSWGKLWPQHQNQEDFCSFDLMFSGPKYQKWNCFQSRAGRTLNMKRCGRHRGTLQGSERAAITKRFIHTLKSTKIQSRFCCTRLSDDSWGGRSPVNRSSLSGCVYCLTWRVTIGRPSRLSSLLHWTGQWEAVIAAALRRDWLSGSVSGRLAGTCMCGQHVLCRETPTNQQHSEHESCWWRLSEACRQFTVETLVTESSSDSHLVTGNSQRLTLKMSLKKWMSVPPCLFVLHTLWSNTRIMSKSYCDYFDVESWVTIVVVQFRYSYLVFTVFTSYPTWSVSEAERRVRLMSTCSSFHRPFQAATTVLQRLTFNLSELWSTSDEPPRWPGAPRLWLDSHSAPERGWELQYHVDGSDYGGPSCVEQMWLVCVVNLRDWDDDALKSQTGRAETLPQRQPVINRSAVTSALCQFDQS